MAQYPIKMLKDENGTPFVPLVAPEAVKDNQGTDWQALIDKKLEKTNIIAGDNITLSVSGNDITISCDYLNDTIDNSKLKSAILVGLSENKSFTVSAAWSDIKIPFDNVIRKIGDGFSLDASTGNITASEKVKNVKVTLGITVNNNISGNVYPRIYSQSGISNFTESGDKTTGQIRNETIDKCDTSKTIQGGFRCSGTGEVILMGTEQYTYMLVEEL